MYNDKMALIHGTVHVDCPLSSGQVSKT